jgi:L-rhamnose isomerase
MNDEILKKYNEAKVVYQKYGVDVDKALEVFNTIPVSLQCWAGDDIKGFEDVGNIHSENVVTGNYPSYAKNGLQLREDIEKAFEFSPLKHKVALHSIYAEHHHDRNKLTAEDFREWIDWAKEKGYGLDFNTTFFAHPMMDDGNSATSLNDRIRDYWVECGRGSRAISVEIGRELGQKCYNNFWFPDGSKDTPVNKKLYRNLLKESLDKMFTPSYTEDESKFACDCVEGKIFGISTEAFVAGSHYFYLGYAATHNCGLTLDMGHFNVGEDVSDIISGARPFVKDMMLHVSRGIHWDSDHVVIENEALNNMMLELKRGNYYGDVGIGLDYFDASINRVYGWVIGLRATAKAILNSLLDPTDLLNNAELEGNKSLRLFVNEEKNNLPFNDVWNYLLEKKNIKSGLNIAKELDEYEKNVQMKR